MAITTLNNRSINRSDTASADQLWTATSATATDFQAAAAGGAWEYIARQTLASDASDIQFKDGTAATDGTPDFGSDYAAIVFHLEHWTPATDNAVAQFLLSTDTGSSYPTGNYLAGGVYRTFSSGVATSTFIENTNFLKLSGGIENSLANGVNGCIWIHNTSDTAHAPYANWHLLTMDSAGTSLYELVGGGSNTTNQNVDAIKFYFGVGNVLAGSTIRMYGLKAS